METWAVRVIVWVASLSLGVIRGVHSYQKPRSTAAVRKTGAVQTMVLAVSFVGFIVPLVWAGTSCLIGCIVLAGLRMRIEEAMLVERFGQAYRDYASRTPALVPRPQSRRT